MCQKLRKCAKSWDLWESILKAEKVWKKCAKSWKSMRKCAKSWERMPKAYFVCSLNCFAVQYLQTVLRAVQIFWSAVHCLPFLGVCVGKSLSLYSMLLSKTGRWSLITDIGDSGFRIALSLTLTHTQTHAHTHTHTLTHTHTDTHMHAHIFLLLPLSLTQKEHLLWLHDTLKIFIFIYFHFVHSQSLFKIFSRLTSSQVKQSQLKVKQDRF